jgi:hypothetical protein
MATDQCTWPGSCAKNLWIHRSVASQHPPRMSPQGNAKLFGPTAHSGIMKNASGGG